MANVNNNGTSTMDPMSADRFASSTDEYGQPRMSGGDNTPSTMDNVKNTLSDAKDKVTQKAGDLAHSVSDTASNMAQSVSNTASNVAQSVSSKASDLSGQVKDQAQRAANATGDFYQGSPLAVGAIALLIGAAVGLMIPATDPENRWMGETRDRLKDQATQQLQTITDKVSTVAQTALDSAKQSVQQEAQNQGLTAVAA
jgi:ElaB/YqjD/DUF883 family membrane-anchored ribosome-binding protein